VGYEIHPQQRGGDRPRAAAVRANTTNRVLRRADQLRTIKNTYIKGHVVPYTKHPFIIDPAIRTANRRGRPLHRPRVTGKGGSCVFVGPNLAETYKRDSWKVYQPTGAEGNPKARPDPCGDRARYSRSLKVTTAGYTPEMVERVLRHHQGEEVRSRSPSSTAHRERGPERRPGRSPTR